jgi:hypothetical protein
VLHKHFHCHAALLLLFLLLPCADASCLQDKQPADLQQVIAALHFLSQLGMTDEQVVKTVKNFPEVLGCDVQQQLQANVDKLYVDWKLQGDVLVKAVLRNPAVLGYNLDCMGDCAGECNRCWARF